MRYHEFHKALHEAPQGTTRGPTCMRIHMDHMRTHEGPHTVPRAPQGTARGPTRYHTGSHKNLHEVPPGTTEGTTRYCTRFHQGRDKQPREAKDTHLAVNITLHELSPPFQHRKKKRKRNSGIYISRPPCQYNSGAPAMVKPMQPRIPSGPEMGT